MTTMDVVQVFNDELQSLLDTKPPVSKAKMGLITRAAMKGVKFYKHIVLSVEKFVSKCRPEYKVPGLYVIDSIVRQSRHQFGSERDVYAARFSRNLQSTFNNLFTGCLNDDKPKIVRVLNLWQKNGVFNSHVILPLLDMANPNSALTLQTESTLSADSPSLESSKQNSKYTMHHQNNSNQQYSKNAASSSKTSRGSDGGLRFSKNMLDFDYDEDDEDDGDETPTEAEPPLSSTLNKIEMEQRNRNELPASSHPSSQMHQFSQQSVQQSHLSNQISSRQVPDPVLERWNRLIGQQSITDDKSSQKILSSENKIQQHSIPRARSRSRSPIQHDRLVIKKESPKPKTKSPVHVSNERESEKKAERERKCLPPIRDKHLTVCSSTLWLGHVPKTVSEADISNAFGEYGSITSIDLIPPRGCAYVCMDRRQDAKRALNESRDLKLNNSHVKMAWAPGKGFKEYKKLKDFWEVDIGCSYIPYAKIDESIDFDVLEEGGVLDEDSMSIDMRDRKERKALEKENKAKGIQTGLNLPLPTLPILSQPPPFSIPPPNLGIPPPTALNQASGIPGIPFPPPIVTSTNSQMQQQQQQHHQHNFDDQDSQDRDGNDNYRSPPSLDQQLNMTERQISMVEQQLSMIQQAQGLTQSQTNPMHHMHPQSMFHQGQPNPMLFDLHRPPQMIHGAPPMMDQQIPIFANPPQMLGQPNPMLPINQSGMNPNMNGSMQHYGGGRY